jgi:DNA-binding response OmpR family regulator
MDILLVEDDRRLVAMLDELLTEEGYAVTVARDGHTALHNGLTRTFDALVVDRGLPAIEGVDLIGRLRSAGVVAPILILTARGTVTDRVDGLNAGADDYIVKPFDVDELLARLRALLRRKHEQREVMRIGKVVFDVPRRRVTVAGKEIALSVTEAQLLQHLAAEPRRIFTREEILGAVFGDAESPGVVDTYVHYLRRKLGRRVIETVYGVGYRIGAP